MNSLCKVCVVCREDRKIVSRVSCRRFSNGGPQKVLNALPPDPRRGRKRAYATSACGNSESSHKRLDPSSITIDIRNVKSEPRSDGDQEPQEGADQKPTSRQLELAAAKAASERSPKAKSGLESEASVETQRESCVTHTPSNERLETRSARPTVSKSANVPEAPLTSLASDRGTVSNAELKLRGSTPQTNSNSDTIQFLDANTVRQATCLRDSRSTTEPLLLDPVRSSGPRTATLIPVTVQSMATPVLPQPIVRTHVLQSSSADLTNSAITTHLIIPQGSLRTLTAPSGVVTSASVPVASQLPIYVPSGSATTVDRTLNVVGGPTEFLRASSASRPVYDERPTAYVVATTAGNAVLHGLPAIPITASARIIQPTAAKAEAQDVSGKAVSPTRIPNSESQNLKAYSLIMYISSGETFVLLVPDHGGNVPHAIQDYFQGVLGLVAEHFWNYDGSSQGTIRQSRCSDK